MINNMTPEMQNQKTKSFKQIIKGSLMHAVVNNTLEESIWKLVKKGIERHRLQEFNYSALDVFFENEKKVNSTSASINEQKFLKQITIDAYRDPPKINKVYLNWKKSKLIHQNELRERLEIEKEAAGIMTNLVYLRPPKSMLKDLYHMWNEMMNRYNKAEKREAFKIIINFANIPRKSISHQENGDSQSIVTTTARIKKNFSFSSSKGFKDPNTVSVHNSLQRESKQSESDFKTEALLDYPTAVSAQSSNKFPHKTHLKKIDIYSNEAVS